MIDFNPAKENCTGCTACYSVCPVQAIKMEADDEGFLYPSVGEGCIHCGMCERVCPIVNIENWTTEKNKSLERAFCGITKNKKVWNASASGGAFTEICKAFGDNETVVYGAAWEGLSVHHIRVQGVDAIAPLRKSKYVESNIGSCYSQIMQELKNGIKVVFCGTPCQVAGLRQFIGDIPDNLFMIDFICHGVGSPKVFRRCVDKIGRQFGKTVESYEFRAKRGYHETDYLSKISFTDHTVAYLSGDPYMQLFLKQDCLRVSCGKNCRFRCEYRQGDITIADFKCIDKVFPDLSGSKKNYSTIVINTPKGENLIPDLKKQMVLRECSIEDVKRYNPLFSRQTIYSVNRDPFFVDFVKDGERAVDNRTEKANIMKKGMMRTLWVYLPIKIRRHAIKIVKRIAK